MADHAKISAASGIGIYFCKPHSAVAAGDERERQRAAARLLPKGTDLAGHTAAHLLRVQNELNKPATEGLELEVPSRGPRTATVVTSMRATVATFAGARPDRASAASETEYYGPWKFLMCQVWGGPRSYPAAAWIKGFERSCQRTAGLPCGGQLISLLADSC